MKTTNIIIRLLVIYAMYCVITNFLEKTTIADVYKLVREMRRKEATAPVPVLQAPGAPVSFDAQVDLAKMQIDLYKQLMLLELNKQAETIKTQIEYTGNGDMKAPNERFNFTISNDTVFIRTNNPDVYKQYRTKINKLNQNFKTVQN